MDNFKFLETKYPSLYLLGSRAEQFVDEDPNLSMIKAGMLAENLVKLIFRANRIQEPQGQENTALERIKILTREGFLPDGIKNLLHSIRKVRNNAVHNGLSDGKVASIVVKMAFSVAQWFLKVYGDPDYKYQDYVEIDSNTTPKLQSSSQKTAIASSLEKGTAENNTSSVKSSIPKLHLNKGKANAGSKTSETQLRPEDDEEELIKADEKSISEQKCDAKEIKERSIRFENQRPHSEAETRELIDEQLRSVGWEVDTQNITYQAGCRPQKGRNLAIAEWPTKPVAGRTAQCRVDYALFIGLRLVGFIEAKAMHKDVSSVIDTQAKSYASNITDEDYKAGYIKDECGQYGVPFIFATNGRPYLEQIKEKSGIWFCDLRAGTNIPKALQGWMSPQGLEDLLSKNEKEAAFNLKGSPLDKLMDHDGLALRNYQIDAILAVENAILAGQENILVAMATGTGKTRTILGLIYRLLESKVVKRVLYLVDRNALGEQTSDVFKYVKLSDNLSLDQMYDIKGLSDVTIEKDTRLQIATVQSMVKRVLYFGESASTEQCNAQMPGVNDYDLIIIDEAHRGYILDQELTDDEMLYRDQADFQSKYRKVLDYFTGIKVGITATPAAHTVQIFGDPVFSYSYRQAVLDGYLVDQDAPHIIETELSKNGIKFNKGDELEVLVDSELNETKLFKLEDELDFDVKDFNTKVITESFNRAVLKEVERYIDPSSPEISGKTLIFAATDLHADMIVNILRDHYKDSNLKNDAIVKITGKAGDGDQKRIRELIRRFKNENFPSVVVTVDLLTTGIDIPQITSLVFLRRVKSRILYEQMLGRATRLCPAINKDHFDIFDAVGVCEAMKSATAMKSVVQNPKQSFDDACSKLENAKDDNEIKYLIDNLKAKLQRKIKALDDDAKKEFKRRSGGREIGAILEEFSNITDLHKQQQFLLDNLKVIKSLDEIKSNKKCLIISHHEDTVVAHERLYGDYNNPEDFIEALKRYLKENRDLVEIMNLIETRPSDLKYADLKNLMQKLDESNFRKEYVDSAVKAQSKKSADMCLDLVSLLRNIAFNMPLSDHEQNIRQAINAIKNEFPELNAKQINWLNRIENYLIKNKDLILNVELFNEERIFKDGGKFKKLNSIFDDKLTTYIDKINDYLYNQQQGQNL